MMFERPRKDDEYYSPTEVGITHPETNGFLRLRDNGAIELFADEGVGIYFDPKTRSIVLVGDQIKFMTKKEKGLRWNQSYFNEKATQYQEPTFVAAEDDDAPHLFSGVETFLSPSVLPTKKVTDPQTGNDITYEEYYRKYKRLPRFGSS